MSAPGDFFVDQSCIDCDACRQIAPEVYGEDAEAGLSYVVRQPREGAQMQRALMALVACPTGSIRTLSKVDVTPGVRGFPEPLGDGIYYCGFTSESSFGASSYLAVRPEGNLLVDSPRAARPLMKAMEALGGVATLFLTHRDDVADHEAFHRRFGCARVIHADDAERSTRDVERIVTGTDPIELGKDLLAIPVPGHTRGSMVLLYRNVLFTGDHVWGEEDETLGASRSACWYSWSEQIRSMERLLDYSFDWILPGHGRRIRASSPDKMRVAIEALIERMRKR